MKKLRRDRSSSQTTWNTLLLLALIISISVLIFTAQCLCTFNLFLFTFSREPSPAEKFSRLVRQIDFHKLDREEEESKEEEPVDATDKGDKLEIDKVEKGSENKDKARIET